MSTMQSTSTLGSAKSLVDDGLPARYLFVEHTLEPRHATPYVRSTAQRSYVLVDGSLELDMVEPDGLTRCAPVGRLAGWHAPSGSVFRLRVGSDGAVVVEAGTGSSTPFVVLPTEPPTAAVAPLSEYTVWKPWGHEVWYSQNLSRPGYAFKQIHMTTGHQSSLQSHQQKAETNYVVDGEATVLNGLQAPEDTGESIDVDRIPVHRHRPGTCWTSAPNILHRVIAESTYTSLEVSTPELDDVIRWQDDAGRGNGRIAAEHSGAVR